MPRAAATLIAVFLVMASTPIAASLVGTVSGGVAMPRLEANGAEASGEIGYDIGLSLGWQLNDWVRWDAFEFHYMSTNQNNVFGNFTSDSLILGSAARVGIFKRDWRIHPYLSAGVGGNWLSHEQGPSVQQQWALQWSAGAGIEFQIDYFTAVGVRYRYRSTRLDSYPPVSAGETRMNLHTIAIELVVGGE
jgi:opacity protein-like surface antigen